MFNFLKSKTSSSNNDLRASTGTCTGSSTKSGSRRSKKSKSKPPSRSFSSESEALESYDTFDKSGIPLIVTRRKSFSTSKTAKDSLADDVSSVGNDDVAGGGAATNAVNNLTNGGGGGGTGKCPYPHDIATISSSSNNNNNGGSAVNVPIMMPASGSSPSLCPSHKSEEWDNFAYESSSTSLDKSSTKSNTHRDFPAIPTPDSFDETLDISTRSDPNNRSTSFKTARSELKSSSFHSIEPARRMSVMTEASRRQSMSYRHLETQAKSIELKDGHRKNSLGTNNSGNCPFFVGAADTNANLLLSSVADFGLSMEEGLPSHHGHGFYDTKVELVEHRTETGTVTLREEIVVDFSYTAVNPEFPKPIKEADLFNNPTSDGLMSRKHGFLVPDYESALSDLLEARGRIWYSMGKRMEGLMASNRLLPAIDDMDIVDGDEVACPDGSLQLAASLLAYLTYGHRAACWRNKISYVPCPSLQIPFKKISQRLGRKDVYFAPEDFMYNQRPIRGNLFEFDNLEIMSPLYGTAAESLMSKLFCESNRYLFQMQDAILALCRGEWRARHIHRMIFEVKLLTRMFGKAIPDTSAGSSSIDPVEFATAFANATAPFKEGVPALSGAGCPVFVILDLIIGRKHWNSAMGKDTLMQVVWMPKNWRRYIEYIRQSRLFEKVPADLQYLWQLLKEVYCGERGWLGKHKYRAYQFVELAGALGRTSNKGATSGSATIEMLEESRRERDATISDDRSSYKTCNFKGTIKSANRASEDRSTKLVTIKSYYPLSMQEGDHVAVVMKNSDDHIWRFSSEKGLNVLDHKLTFEDGTLTKEWEERLDFEKLDHTIYNVLMCAKLRVAEKLDISIETLCTTLYPEEPRLYSFATVNPSSREEDGCVTEFDLLVTRTGPGGCSAFLFESVGQEVSFGLSTAVKCDLPTVKTQPLVVIAAGSGLGTYLPLLVNQDIDNPKYAFLAFRSENTVPHLYTHLKKEVSYGKLELFVELSREDTTIVSEKRIIKKRKTKKRYIDKLLVDEADLIRELAAPLDEGGMEASFFICGNNDFFKTVRTSLDNIDHGLVSKLVRSNRLQLEVQARGGRDGESNRRPLKLTETCFHNKMSDFWTIIHGIVYDFTEYLPWHPGGRKILHYVAGTDCTEFWDLVSHSRDRMVYSQIAAYEVGQYDDSDPDGLMGFLELVTRCENCVELYIAKEDLFSNLCDSYDKVINVVESIFSDTFVDIACRLVHDDVARSRMLNRVYLARKSVPKTIAKRLFSVAPKIKGLKSRTQKSISGEVQLRPVSDLERNELQTRLVNSGKHFFSVCKRTVVDYCKKAETQDAAGKQTSLVRMFFGLVQAVESLFVSLSQPIPIPTMRKWDVMKAEVLGRKTFVLRFNPCENRVPESVKILTGRQFPSEKKAQESYVASVLETFDVEPPAEYQDDTMMIGTNVIDEWHTQTEVRDLFNRLDTNGDGLVSRDEINSCEPQNDIEVQMLESLKDELEDREDLETYNFEEFLLCSPWLAEKKRMIRVSSLLFKGMMMVSD